MRKRAGVVWGAGILFCGCASSFGPLKPLEKGEIRHGAGVQLMSGSFLNYGLTYGATRWLETGVQAGLVDLGARARLHLPLGPASALALSQSGLMFWLTDPDVWFGRYRLRYEGKLTYLAFVSGWEFGAGPLLIHDWAQARFKEENGNPRAIRVGGSFSFGTPRLAMDFDLSFNVLDADIETKEAIPTADGPELGIRMSWFWGRPKTDPAPRDRTRMLPKAAPSPAEADDALPAADPVPAAWQEFGSEICGISLEKFAAWSDRSPANAALGQAAWKAAQKRKSSAVWKSGLGLAAGVVGAMVFTAGLAFEDLGTCSSPLGGDSSDDSEGCAESSGNGAPLMILGGATAAAGLTGVYLGIRQGFTRTQAEKDLSAQCHE